VAVAVAVVVAVAVAVAGADSHVPATKPSRCHHVMCIPLSHVNHHMLHGEPATSSATPWFTPDSRPSRDSCHVGLRLTCLPWSASFSSLSFSLVPVVYRDCLKGTSSPLCCSHCPGVYEHLSSSIHSTQTLP
jgi:hypothetical protein